MVPSGFRRIAHLCFINQFSKKNDMDWLQQPLQEEYQISVDNSEKPERITRHILGLFEFFSK